MKKRILAMALALAMVLSLVPVVAEHPLFTNIQKNSDFGKPARYYNDHLNLVDFSVLVAQLDFQKGETYNYTLTANLATFDDFVVNEGQFTYG